MRVVMSQGIEDSTELAKTHPASSRIIDELLETRVLNGGGGGGGNEIHKRHASSGIGIGISRRATWRRWLLRRDLKTGRN